MFGEFVIGRAGGRAEEDLDSCFVDYGLGLCRPEGAEESGVVGGGVFTGDNETADWVAVVIGVGSVGCMIIVRA